MNNNKVVIDNLNVLLQHTNDLMDTTKVAHTFNSCHIFSIGLASVESGGARHQFIPLSAKKACAQREVCLGALSCMNLW